MNRFDFAQYRQKGLTHLVLITTTLLILAGIAIAVYLTQFTQIFKPKAAESDNTIHHVLITGQSLSVGGYGWFAPVTTTQPYQNLMLSNNWLQSTLPSRPQQPPPTFAPLILIPFQNGTTPTETIAAGMANLVTKLVPNNNYQMLMTINGLGSQPYQNIKKGSCVRIANTDLCTYALGLDQVAAAKNLALQQNKIYRVDAVAVLHGEADVGNGPLYKGYLKEWIRDYNLDIKAITGQTDDVPMFIDQISSWTMLQPQGSLVAPLNTLPLAQLEAAEENPSSIYLVAPNYFLEYYDGVHLPGKSYAKLGEYYGKAYKKVVVDKQPWVPLSPKSVTISGNIVTLKLNVPVPPIQVDTTQVLAKENYGFEYVDDGASAAISNVRVAGTDTIEVTLSKVPTGNNKRLRYAFTGTPGSPGGAQNPGAPRGNIRDSDTTPSLYGYNLNNWLVHFDKPINSNASPLGTHEGVDNASCLVGGWAYDPDAPGTSIQVSVFRDADADHGGTLIGTYPTDIERPVLNTAKNLPQGSKHGYSIRFAPEKSGLFTGTPREIYVYSHDAVDKTGVRSLHPLANNSPQTITCTDPSVKKKDVQIWFHPNMYFSARHNDLRNNPVDALTFWREETQLKGILPNLAKVGFFPGFWPNTGDYDEYLPQLREAATALKNNNTEMDLSIGGTDSHNGLAGVYCPNYQSAEVTTNVEFRAIDAVIKAGLPLTSLTMDDPLGRTIRNGAYPTDCGYTPEESIREVIQAMKIIHAKYPNLKIGMNVNFANWRYNGTAPNAPNYKTIKIDDYKVVLDEFFDAVRENGEEIAFFHVDNPYEHTLPTPNWHVDPADPTDTDKTDNAYNFGWVKKYFPELIGNPDPEVVDWMQRVIDLEHQVKSYGVRFGVFFNAGMMSSDKEAFDGTVAYVNKYRAKGGRPDDYVIKSWDKAPSKLLPVSEPYTYTNLLATVARIIDTPPIGSVDSINQCTQVVGWACDNDTPSKPVGIQFNADGKYIGFASAGEPGEAGVALKCGGHSAHRFKFDLPPDLQNNQPHTLNIFAINSNSFGQNTQLSGSPITMQCLKPSSSPSPTPFKIGDLNPPAGGDGNVDMADFNIFARYYKDKDLRADFNSNGRVDLADLNMLIRNFGQ